MKTKKIYYDVINENLLNETGKVISANNVPKIFYTSLQMINIQLVTDTSLTPYTELDVTNIFTANIDTDFDHTTSPLCSSLSGEFNVDGDWGVSGDVDLSQGQLSFPIYAGETQFATSLGTKQEINANLEIKCNDATTDNLTEIFVLPVKCKNIIVG